nr:hypothetical protein [Bacteroides intestinalis]
MWNSCQITFINRGVSKPFFRQGYTLSPGWLHPLEVMATPSVEKGVAL